MSPVTPAFRVLSLTSTQARMVHAMSNKIKEYNWTPDLRDQRGHFYAATQALPAKPSKKVNLSGKRLTLGLSQLNVHHTIVYDDARLRLNFRNSSGVGRGIKSSNLTL